MPKCSNCGHDEWTEINWCRENKEECTIGRYDECPTRVPVADGELILFCDNRTKRWECKRCKVVEAF